MNWLIKRLANESTYFPIFLAVLAVYAMIGCVVVHWIANYHLLAIKPAVFLFLFGSAVVAYGGRLAHNLAYAKLLKDEQK
jgi:hypothetical protein